MPRWAKYDPTTGKITEIVNGQEPLPAPDDDFEVVEVDDRAKVGDSLPNVIPGRSGSDQGGVAGR